MANSSLGWAPTQSWVIVIGTLQWEHPDQFPSFPTKLRRDAALANFFAAAGVPRNRIVYLQDAAATLDGIEQAMAALLPQAGPHDLLFFYYCGHGFLLDSGKPCFACYDAGAKKVPGWPMSDLPDLIDKYFKGERAILMADCCHSGSLAESVGKNDGHISYACLTSSLARESSTGNWTFTEGLLAALQGRGFTDADNSNSITLLEMANGIMADMSFAEGQLSQFIVTRSFDPTMVLAPATPKSNPNIGRRVEVLSGTKWHKARIIDANNNSFKVHYFGWEDSDDEWVQPKQIREYTPTQYAIGTLVEVLSEKKWWPAKVLDARNGVHFIKYDGWDASWNEWVSPDRIRVRGKQG